MKKLMFAFCFLFGGFIVVNAQDTTSTSQQNQYPTYTQQQDQDRERINSRDLPDAIKRSLETQEFRGWLVNAAYRTAGTDEQSNQNQTNDQSNQNQSDTTSVSDTEAASGTTGHVYVVELKNGAQTKTVRFDKEGKRLDEGGMDNDQN
jgi:hypothetical protein